MKARMGGAPHRVSKLKRILPEPSGNDTTEHFVLLIESAFVILSFVAVLLDI